MRAILITLITSLSFVLPAHAQPGNDEPDYEWGRTISRTLQHNGQTYAWSVMIPEGAEEGGAAILFLHGAGECGTDGEKNLAVGLPRHVREHPDRWPFVVIVPQKPTRNSEWEDHEEAVLKMLDLCEDEGLIDPDRLAITGLSQGGHGTIMIASRNPDRFKAAAPVCGYVDRRFSEDGTRAQEVPAEPTDESVVEAAKGLQSMPLWLFHGLLDDVVPPDESRALHEALEALDADSQYSEFKDANHNAWDPAYSEPEIGAWFQDHTDE
ncbi:MAG: prolyl oligopeptidase family serine peptidase [Phycisphaerales bacterium]